MGNRRMLIRRLGLGIATIAMTALNFGVLVVLPLRMESGSWTNGTLDAVEARRHDATPASAEKWREATAPARNSTKPTRDTKSEPHGNAKPLSREHA